LLADLLRHGEPEIWRGTSEALMELADWISGTPPEIPEGMPFPAVPRSAEEEIPCDGATAAYVQTAIEESLTTYRHHGQKAVLLALAALAPRPMRVAYRLLSDRESAALPHMKKLLIDAGTPQIRHALLAFCRVSTLTSQAMEGIRRAVAHAKIHEVLATAHLLHAGPIARVIARLPEPEHLSPPLLDINDFPAAQAAALPTWIDALSLEPGQRVAALASLAKAPQVEARLTAIRRLIGVGDPVRAAALEAVASFCTDSDPAVARIALRHLLRNRWPGLARVLVHLINSPHADIRKLAGGQLVPLGFNRFWDAWPSLNFAQQMAAGRALIKLDPGFHRLLGERLASQERNTSLRAMAIIFGLNQGNLFEAPLIALSGSTDQVIAATAVRTLGSGQTATAVHVLEGALEHADSRVRANAVESLDQLKSSQHLKQLLEMANRDEGRPRANAIKSLMNMRAGDALEALVRMLNDPRPKQRTSALWLVDQLGLTDVARHVAEMSITDPDREVKSRAGGVIHHLIDAMRTGTEKSKEAKAG
jgi:HEAT repeat protein